MDRLFITLALLLPLSLSFTVCPQYKRSAPLNLAGHPVSLAPLRPSRTLLLSSEDEDDGNETNVPFNSGNEDLSEEDQAALKAARKAAFEEKIKEMGATTTTNNDDRETFTYGIQEMTKAPVTQDPPTNVKLPLLGTFELDGSTLVVVPAATIGVLGVLTSIYIGLTSTDSVEKALEQLREDEKRARSAKVVPKSECRGLCGSQEDDLRMKMERSEGKTGTEKALSIFF